ncbi:MAG: RHS repeat-associated core domain-containing protein [Polyangiaceae bacterium]|nr:RHS repeat-associated core domain-containing protein [Polyangiaceae bacterium]
MFVNDGFGDLLASTDALGRVITFGVDALGRVQTRTDTHAGKSLTTTWTWDTAPNGIGQLRMLESPDGIKTYAYSKRGQLEGMTLSVAGESFTARMTYDDVGRPKALQYPQPLGALPFGVTYEHDKHGHRIGVRDTYTNDAYWQLTDVDQAGRYKGELFGNGVTTARGYDHEKGALKSITTTKGAATIQQLAYAWDERLNLKSRTDALQAQNTTERFQYDGLNRLTCAHFGLVENPNAPCDTSYGYAPNGNLVSKSDVGILSYTDPTHPHAVTNAAGDNFYHDAVGNQITRPGGVAITYTPFDLPTTITQGAKATTFGYDGDQQRIRKTTSTTETIYFDDLYEQVKTASGIEHRYHVHSPERTIAIVTRGGQEPGTRYLHVDHIGSIETTTKENGAIDERRSYDAFGARRSPDWGGAPIAFTSKTKKGFTGHEEADEFGLVNMKGRVYDPRIGRFTTTDPIIANVYNGQSFGAYTYVRNNPLTFVDPSGFTEEEARRLWRVEETGQLGIHITFDQLPAPTPRPAPPSQAADVGAGEPTTDVGTTGNGDVIKIPVIETPHPSGPGTDDPFRVYPPDIELGYSTPITTFDQLVAGDPAAGRRTFIIEDDPGLARDLRHAFGPERQTIMLRPRIGGEAGNDRSRARQNLVVEAILTAATILTPGPLDDMAVGAVARAPGLRVVRSQDGSCSTSCHRTCRV